MRITIELRRPARRSIALLVAALLLLAPAVVLANHQFPDVPTSHPFHGQIGAIAGAGITTGFPDGGYHPSDPVTREAMAAFMHRGMGRVAEADFQKAITGTASTTVGSLSITPGIAPGAVAGANQFLRAEFTGTVRFSNITNCPCSIAVYLTANGSAFTNFASATTVSVVNHYANLSSSGVVPVSGSDPVTVALVAYIVTGGGASTAYTLFANVDVQTLPFGSAGGDTLSADDAFRDDPLAVPRE
jgi:S-layer homology domain